MQVNFFCSICMCIFHCLRYACAGVKRLARLGMVDNAPGMSALDMNTAEDMIVRNTREVVPGMIICGMEVGSQYYLIELSSYLQIEIICPYAAVCHAKVA